MQEGEIDLRRIAYEEALIEAQAKREHEARRSKAAEAEAQMLAAYREKRRRADVVSSVMSYGLIAIGLVVLSISSELPGVISTALGNAARPSVLLFGGLLMVLGFFNGILLYLNGRLKVPMSSVNPAANGAAREPVSDSKSHGFDPRVDAILQRIEELQKAQIAATTATAHEDVVQALLPLVQNSIGDVLAAKFAQHALDNDRVESVRKAFRAAETRLAQELTSLRARANLNLAIGAATTVVAIALLYWLVLGSERTFENLYALLSHYIPRVSIVVFIEIFAFFFLRLYRTTLTEIRGYQGDVTRLNLQYIAVEMAWADESTAARRGFAEALLSANSAPGEMPVPEAKIDEKAISTLLEKLSKLLPSQDAK